MESAEKFRVNSHDLAEDTIEKCWIPLWDKVHKFPLDDESARFLVKLFFIPERECKDFMDKAVKDEYSTARLVHESMMKRFDINLSSKVQLLLSCLFDNPGNFVMIFAYMKWKMHQLGIKVLNFDDFNLKVFPSGFPDKEGLDWLWQCQKLITNEDDLGKHYTGNLLDVEECYKSFC